MNKKKVLECLKQDMDRRDIPEFWDKIQENRRNRSQISAITFDQPKPTISSTLLKILKVGAIVMLAVNVVPAVILLCMFGIPGGMGSATPKPHETSAIPEIPPDENNSSSPKDLITQLEEKQVYGEFRLSDRSEEELQMFLDTYHKDSKVYEDNDYLYNFDEKGNLTEMILINHESDNDIIASREDIEKSVYEIFQTYFPDRNIYRYQIEIIERKNVSPPWTAELNLYESNIVISHIRMTFNQQGKLQYLSLPEITENVGSISKEQAVQIALEEARSPKYTFDSFDDNDVEIVIKYQEQNDQKYYYVDIRNIPLKDDFYTDFGVHIDIYTGDILKTMDYIDYTQF